MLLLETCVWVLGAIFCLGNRVFLEVKCTYWFFDKISLSANAFSQEVNNLQDIWRTHRGKNPKTKKQETLFNPQMSVSWLKGFCSMHSGWKGFFLELPLLLCHSVFWGFPLARLFHYPAVSLIFFISTLKINKQWFCDVWHK